MIDTSSKFETLRMARAEARVKMTPRTVKAIEEKSVPKGDVLETARTAGVMAAKKTAELIPFCHPLAIDFVRIKYELGKNGVVIRSEVKSIGKTGVEMEALTAVSVAALTIYDMLKPLDKKMAIQRIILLEKKGGKSDYEDNFDQPLKGAVLVISDSTFKGERKDKSGKLIMEKLKDYPVDCKEYKILPDERSLIAEELRRLTDEEKLDIVLTTGGTGLGPRDITPEATLDVLQRDVSGISEVMRGFGQQRTPYAMLSRNAAGVRGKTLIVNLPGSSRGAKESMDILFPGVLHGLKMLWGEGHDHAKKKRRDA
jgi:molybdenum cofactor biosynthesis protein MoaC